jgi:glycosyltransferase involved in cell wall biosynthesis
MSDIVSIIVASFNKEKFISETIESVLKQTCSDWELIIVDDGSTDNTLEIVKSFLVRDNRLQLLSFSENKGANFCRNSGLKLSKGKYVIFLDADDLLLQECIENRKKFIEKENCNFCVFTMGVFRYHLGDSDYKWMPDSKNPLVDFLKHKLPWSILQPIWKREFLISLDGFDESFSRLQDVEMHTRALLAENVKYLQIVDVPDCYSRIDNERKNFSDYVFLERWVSASLQYYFKFYSHSRVIGKSRFLVGTIYNTYVQLLFHYKHGMITKEEFSILEKKLLIDRLNFNIIKKMVFALSKKINSCRYSVPGFNLVIRCILFVL